MHGAHDQLSSSLNPSILAEHFCRAISELRPGVMLLATATSSASLHPLLNIKHVFGSSLKIPAATKGVRQEVSPPANFPDQQILRLAVGDDLDLRTNTTAAGPSAPTQQTSLDYVTLASMTEGYSAADLYDLVASARQRAIVRQVRSGENSVSAKVSDGIYTKATDFEHSRLYRCPSSIHSSQPEGSKSAEVRCKVERHRG